MDEKWINDCLSLFNDSDKKESKWRITANSILFLSALLGTILVVCGIAYLITYN